MIEEGDIVRVRDWPGCGREKYRVLTVRGKYGEFEDVPDYANVVALDGSPVRSIPLDRLKIVRKAEDG